MQSADRQEEGAHQTPNERFHGLGASSSSSHVKAVSEPSEFGAQQVIGKTLEVSTQQASPLEKRSFPVE